MAKAYLVPPPQWAKHLRDWKKLFWNQNNQEAKKNLIGYQYSLTGDEEDDTLYKK